MEMSDAARKMDIYCRGRRRRSVCGKCESACFVGRGRGLLCSGPWKQRLQQRCDKERAPTTANEREISGTRSQTFFVQHD